MLVLKIRILQSAWLSHGIVGEGSATSWMLSSNVTKWMIPFGGWRHLGPCSWFPCAVRRLSLKRCCLKSRAGFSRLSCTGSVSKMRCTDWHDQRAAVLGSNQQLTGKVPFLMENCTKLDVLWCYTSQHSKT